MKKTIFMLALAFSFASCQKCMECTNESIISGAGQVDYEIEICEGDAMPWVNDMGPITMDEYVSQLEEQGYRCYMNIW